MVEFCLSLRVERQHTVGTMGPLFSIVAVKHLGGTHGKLKRNVFCHPGGLIQNLVPGLSEEGLAAAANLSGSEKHD